MIAWVRAHLGRSGPWDVGVVDAGSAWGGWFCSQHPKLLVSSKRDRTLTWVLQ